MHCQRRPALDRRHQPGRLPARTGPDPRPVVPGPAHRSETGLLLLHDLRDLRDLHDLYLGAAGNSLYGEMLARAAQAAREERLLEPASFCHPRTLRQMRWANSPIKNQSPQILTSR
ncbi:hypothetical protein [Streptomyces yangpuensis]